MSEVKIIEQFTEKYLEDDRLYTDHVLRIEP